MTTAFFSQITAPHYEAWQAAGAPDHFAAPAFPQFSTRITYRGGYFIVEQWQTSFVSLQGNNYSGHTLRCIGAVNVTKKSELGAKRFNVSDAARWVLNAAHEAWIAAGKPAEFTYIQ
jgi:hypothetical protein